MSIEVTKFKMQIKGKMYDAINVYIGSDNKTLVSFDGALLELDSLDREEVIYPERKEVWID